ncbi:c-type cytochrome [Undibacterium sp. TJN25]|uniref:c-type cytochrome n=1 Tax=Undibacterium sp. TJN25 TaxID=3413056 RepID=UPI003BF2E86B
MKTLIFLLAAALYLTTSAADAAGDAVNGKLLYGTHCIACHSIEASLAGPAHRGVFGRRAGSVRDFEYSPALAKSHVIWNDDTLNKWLANPEKLIPGQQMNYSIPAAQDRADLIAYLKTQTAR